MIEDKTETLSKVLKTIFIKSTFKDIKDTSLLQEKLKTVIRMSKHLQKDINYRCKICFDHWKTTKHCKFIVYDPLKTITISQTFEILIQKQTKSFFTALKIAEQKQESLKTHKLGLVYQGFKHLLPYYKHLKQRYWNKWTVQTEIKLDVSQRIALNRVFRILGRFETSYYQRFLSLIKFYVSSRVKSVQNLCRIFKSKFKIRFENLNIHRNIELLSSKQLKVYYKKIGMSNLGLSINKRIRNCRKSGFDNILTHAKSLYFSSLPLPKLRKL